MRARTSRKLRGGIIINSVFLLLLCLLPHVSCIAQDKPVLLTDTVALKSIWLNSRPWKFHPGDSLQWAQPGFSGSSWVTLSGTGFGRDRYSRTPMPAGWQGFGWFRLWVKKQDLSLTDSWDLFNGSVLVARHGKLVYEKQLGLANKEFGIPISEHTKFEMASLAKPFTALLILQLVQNGAEFKRQADYDPKLPSFY